MSKQHFSIDKLKAELGSILNSFEKKQYFAAHDAAKTLTGRAKAVQSDGNITEVLLLAIEAVNEDMHHAYNTSNFDSKPMISHLKFAITKSNKNHVTESEAQKAAAQAAKDLAKKKARKK